MRWPGWLTWVLGGLGCVDGLVPSPFAGSPGGPDAGPTAEGVGGDAGPAPVGVIAGAPGVLFGAPCVDDQQCDDGLDCTSGVCDAELGLCRFTGDDARCDDGVFCNGIERCDLRLGCRPGPPTSCSDATPCSIDTCDEATRSCVRRERDVDGDGDIDGNCQPGGDCNDLDPRVSSQAAEICNNGVDDDCDGTSDEAECQQPEFDTCDAALVMEAPGSYVLTPDGARLDYGAACASAEPALRELVLQVEVAPGPALDVELSARSARGQLSFARPEACGRGAGPSACVRGAYLPNGESAARLRLHGAEPGLHPVYLLTNANVPIQVEMAQFPASAPPGNLDCAAALPLEPGEPVVADLALAGEVLDSACASDRGDLLYAFTLDQPSEVRLVADSLDGVGQPRLSLRSENCSARVDELACDQGSSASVRRHALEAGTYVVAVSATGPTRTRLSMDVGPPTAAPPSDQCASAPALAPNRPRDVSFIDHVDDIESGCLPGVADAAFVLEVTDTSDLLLLGRFSPGDVGSISLAGEACGAGDTRGCSPPGANPARVAEHNLSAGRYRVLMESASSLPATLTAALRPARPPTPVPAAEACREAVTIGPEGGFFQGTTLNAEHDASASCDFATPNGAPDQFLRLVLDRPRRVIMDMRGSDFDTLLNVRSGASCPGQEVAGGCSVGAGDDRSFLDLRLPEGEYFLQIDGYAGALGSWFLDVFILDP